MGCAGKDVLPAIGLEELSGQIIHFLLRHGASAPVGEIPDVGHGLRLQDAVHRLDQRNEVVHAPVALFRRKTGVVTPQLQLVKYDCDSSFQWNRNTSLNSGDSSPSGSMLWI